MRFRAPTESPIRVALTSGHTTIITRAWRDDLPEIFHRPAMSAGCERDDTTHAPVEMPVRPSREATQQSESPDDAYRRALTEMLEREQEGDFTRDSLPNINAVSKVVGFTARKEDVLRVFRAMKDEADADA